MIVAVAAPDSSHTRSLAALELARTWRRRNRDVQLVSSEPRQPRPTGVERTSISTAGITTLQLGEDLRRSSTRHERTIVEMPRDAFEFQRATLSVADVALLICAPGGDGLWPSGRTVQMAHNAAEIRSPLHAGLVLTETALRDASADDARPGRHGLPLFESLLDLSATPGGSNDDASRIRRSPSAREDAGVEMLVGEIEDLAGRSQNRTDRNVRHERHHAAK